VTPVARRRPEQLARQVAMLDVLSGGRVIFGAGLGGPVDDEFGSFGDTTDEVVLAERLDEGLELLGRFWSGEPVDHDGPHYTVRDVRLLPAPVQQPRPPVWIGGFWPARRPMRRAARWDGVAPLFRSATHGNVPPLHELRELVAYVEEHGAGSNGRPFDVVIGGVSPADPSAAEELVGSLAEAGVTWWDERQHLMGEDIDRLAPVLRRIEQGPPRA
jgi:alkanesulfonate monooxygenase SsuD/methylene tetrahydromethanopterin reductase-like flavin-dependent oxidoreductase (luciferase family)